MRAEGKPVVPRGGNPGLSKMEHLAGPHQAFPSGSWRGPWAVPAPGAGRRCPVEIGPVSPGHMQLDAAVRSQPCPWEIRHWTFRLSFPHVSEHCHCHIPVGFDQQISRNIYFWFSWTYMREPTAVPYFAFSQRGQVESPTRASWACPRSAFVFFSALGIYISRRLCSTRKEPTSQEYAARLLSLPRPIPRLFGQTFISTFISPSFSSIQSYEKTS